jgi:hypothetical protein
MEMSARDSNENEEWVSSGMLCHVALVRTNISEERSASKLGTTLEATSNQRTLQEIP